VSDLRRRVEELRAVTADHMALMQEHHDVGPVIEEQAWLICDGCGIRINLRRVVIDLRLDQWHTEPGHDFCPECVADGRHKEPA
jgi:UDP-N-acetyl-D-mannosaminuronic acid transferase (WecB/TagA/CpsF family)